MCPHILNMDFHQISAVLRSCACVGCKNNDRFGIFILLVKMRWLCWSRYIGYIITLLRSPMKCALALMKWPNLSHGFPSRSSYNLITIKYDLYNLYNLYNLINIPNLSNYILNISKLQNQTSSPFIHCSLSVPFFCHPHFLWHVLSSLNQFFLLHGYGCFSPHSLLTLMNSWCQFLFSIRSSNMLLSNSNSHESVVPAVKSQCVVNW